MREMAEPEEPGGERDKRKRGDKPGKRKGQLDEKARQARAARRKEGPRSGPQVNLIWVVAHPVRRRILRVIAAGDEPLSPALVGDELGVPAATVAYHANILRRFGAVEPVGEGPVRGGPIERSYDFTIEDEPSIETLLEETREADEGRNGGEKDE
jgi:hypothetical protein